MDRLDPRIRPYAVDLPGHGDLGGAVPDDMDVVAESVLAAAAEFRIEPPWDVVGHSLGGLVALHLAITNPGRVRRLGLLASAARMGVHPALEFQLRARQFDEAFLARAFTPGTSHDLVRMIVDDARRTGTVGADYCGVRKIDHRATSARIELPTLVLAVESDPVIAPRKSRALATTIPSAALITVSGSGHYVHLERPDVVADAINNLVLSVDSGGRR